MSQQVWNIGHLLNWTEQYFIDHKIDTPRLDAEILLSHTLDYSRIQLYTLHDEPVSQDNLITYKSLIKRRIQHEPVAYIIGTKEFYRQTYKIDSHVLIPRPETEFIIDTVLELYSSNLKDSYQFCEVGTGSGNICTSLALELCESKIITFEICPKASKTAMYNIENLKTSDQIQLIQADYKSHIEDNLPEYSQKFDLFVSNPPYIAKAERETLPNSVIKYEPQAALIAQNEGLAFYEDFSVIVPMLLKPNGFLVLEIGYKQADAIKEIFSKSNQLNLQKTVKDYNNIERVLVWQKV